MRRTLLAGVVVAGLFAWQASGLAAQPAGQSGTVTAQEGQPKSGKKAGAKAGATKAESGAADSTFVKEAASGGMMEVELGRMAANQASSDDVKKFGQRMVDDHSKANNELSALAQKKNITLPTEMGKKEQATRDHLAKLNGAAFDKAYMQHMVTDHTKDVREFERESKSGKDADVKAWAGQTLPTLQDHLKQAKQVAAAVRGEPAGKVGKSGKKSSGESKK